MSGILASADGDSRRGVIPKIGRRSVMRKRAGVASKHRSFAGGTALRMAGRRSAPANALHESRERRSGRKSQPPHLVRLQLNREPH
jgi:hypothetical protein